MGCHAYIQDKEGVERETPWVRFPPAYYDTAHTKSQFAELIKLLRDREYPCGLLRRRKYLTTIRKAISGGHLPALVKRNTSERTSCCSFPCWEMTLDFEAMQQILEMMDESDTVLLC